MHSLNCIVHAELIKLMQKEVTRNKYDQKYLWAKKFPSSNQPLSGLDFPDIAMTKTPHSHSNVSEYPTMCSLLI